MTVVTPQLSLRSHDATWNEARWEQLWEQLPDDGNQYEVIDGVLYMSTAPSQFHGWVVKRLVRVVGTPLEDQGLYLVYWAPMGVFMPGCDPVQPDFFLIRHDRTSIIPDQRIRGVPDLIAEVLSPSNPEQDTDVKRHAYARAGLPEYWIVRPASRDVLVYWEPDAAVGDFTRVLLVGPDEELVSPTLPARFSVAELFAGAPNTML